MTAAEVTASQSATILQLIRRMLSYAKPYIGMLLLILLLTFVYSLGQYGRAYLIKPLIDYVLLPSQVVVGSDGAPPSIPVEPKAAQVDAVGDALGIDLPTPSLSPAGSDADTAFRNIVIIAIAIVILGPISLFGRVYLTNWVLGRITRDIQREIAAKLLAVPLSFHRSGTTGDILSRSLNDANAVEKIGNSSFTINYEGWLGEELRLKMQAVHAFVELTQKKSVPIPDIVRERMKAFMA